MTDEDMEKQVDDVFERMGGGLLQSKRSRSIDDLEAHPFFVCRGGVVPKNSGGTRAILTTVMPRFDLGYVMGTPLFKERVRPDEAVTSLCRHAIGDSGDIGLADAELNESAIVDGGRIISRYVSKEGYAFYIITESDRSTTTCLLVEEYK